MVKSYKGQSYSSIRKNALKNGLLFEDSEFPANNKSIFYSHIDNEIVWKRPKELCKVPKLIVEGVSCDDLNSGELGNTWFVTACIALAQEPRLWAKVVPEAKEQEWNNEKMQYAGIFKFNFWRFGEWIEIVIDDRLPTKNGKLVFCHSKSRNEFWSALLEKAYAKLFGDYESLVNGYAADALVDFTGGVAEKIDFKKLNITSSKIESKKLFNDLIDALDNRALITCNIKCHPEDVGKEAAQGLILGNGYNVTACKQISVEKSLQGALGSSVLELVRLFNPWSIAEWTGPWSDNSSEWKKVNSRELEKMGIIFTQEGEFWMNFTDFISNFSNMDVCHFVNTSIFSLKKTWNESIMHSEWTHAGRNGGSEYESPTFLSNPQYMFDITNDKDTIMVSVEQHDLHSARQGHGPEHKVIGYHVMKVEENRKYRVHIQGERMFTSDYQKSRSIFGRVGLQKGRYVIVPTTAESGELGGFMLRVYTSGYNNGGELTKEGPTAGCPCASQPAIVTTVTVVKATGLKVMADKQTKTLDPFVIIRCEHEKVKSFPASNTNDPIWQVKGTFYRRKPSEVITVEIWNHNKLMDDFMCETRIDENGYDEGKEIECKLFGRKKEKDSEKPGCMIVHIRSNQDLQYL